ELLLVALAQLRGLVCLGYENAASRERAEKKEPSTRHVVKDQVLRLLDKALAEVEDAPGIAEEVSARIVNYLGLAKAEASAESPSWSKVVGALVIVAAMISGMADAPAAAATIRSALDYILQEAAQPQKQLPPPSSGEHDETTAV